MHTGNVELVEVGLHGAGICHLGFLLGLEDFHGRHELSGLFGSASWLGLRAVSSIILPCAGFWEVAHLVACDGLVHGLLDRPSFRRHLDNILDAQIALGGDSGYFA